MVKIRVLYSLVCVLFCFTFCQKFALSRDHAPVSPLHNQATQEFTEKYFLENHRFSEKKVEAFIHRLKLEKKALDRDIYETELLERLELKVQDYKKARKKALEEVDDPQNLAVGYDLYLLPKLQELLRAIREQKSHEEQQSLFDDFIRGYVPYFLPNAFVSLWPRNFDLASSVKHFWLPFSFIQGDEQKAEANNLVVPPQLLKPINMCLQTQHRVNDYLTELELRKLRSCGLDLSLLDPGVSSLWSHEEVEPVDRSLFPTDEERIDYRSINLRGHSSPKIKGEFTRDGKTYKLKIKLGPETQSDIAAGNLFALLGFNRDYTQHRSRLTVHLNKDTFNEFRSEFANKYGIGMFNSLISAYDDRDKNDVTIRLNDVLLEARPQSEIRVAPFDISSWDLSNRREFRALLLLWGWVAMNNTKISNFKFLYKKTKQGVLPLVRMSDTGSSFGSSMDLRKPRNGLGILSILTVNEFAESFLNWDHKHRQVHVRWSDLTHTRRYFAQTTYDDLKWLARKIAALEPERIEQTLRQAGMPDPVAHLLFIKLMKRRNEMVEAFALQKDYPLIPTPKLKNYSPPKYAGSIRKGRLVKKVFAESNQVYEVAEKWATFLPALLSFRIPVARWRDSKTRAAMRSSVQSLNEARGRLRTPRRNFPQGMAQVPLGVGVQALLSRTVLPNWQTVNDGEKLDIYQVIDRVRIRIDIDSPFLQRLVRKVKLIGLDIGIRFYEYDFEFIHYADAIKKAYFSPFRVPQIMQNPNHYAAMKMQPMELIRSYHRFGVEAFAGVGTYNLRPLANNEFSLSGGVRKILNHYLLRDQYGQLHIYHDQMRQNFGGLDLRVGDLDAMIARTSFLRFAITSDQYRYENTDHMLSLPIKDRVLADELLTASQRQNDYELLTQLTRRHNPPEDLQQFYQEYEIKVQGQVKSFGYGGLFLFNKEQMTSESQVEVETPDGEQKQFYRYGLEKSTYVGLQENAMSTYDLFTANRLRQRIVLEMDKSDREDFVVILRNENFHRHRHHRGLQKIIQQANQHYSLSLSEPFFPTEFMPPAEEVDNFRRVHVLTRTFVDGKALRKRLSKAKDKKLKKWAHEHFLAFARNPEHPSFYERLRIRRKVKRTMNLLKKLRDQWQDPEARANMAQKELGQLIVQTLGSLSTYKYGNHFLYQLLSRKDSFVMGDISGVYPSFTTTHDLQQLQRRRFIGNSFGKYTMIPPLQKFLRKNRIVQPSIHIAKTLSDDFIFGELETALPPSTERLWDTDTNF